MSPLDQRAEQFVSEYVEKLAGIFQQELVCIILYGSSLGIYFEPGRSNINLMIVMHELEPERLREAGTLGAKFKVFGIEPIFIAAAELDRLPQFFPIEALEIKENHQVLFGEGRVAPWQVSVAETADQLQRELLAKSLRCRVFFESMHPDPKRLDPFLRELISPYRILMRTLLRWLDERYPPPHEFLEVVAQLEDHLKTELEGFRQVYLLRSGSLKLFKDEIRNLFEKILSETALLADYAIELTRQRSS